MFSCSYVLLFLIFQYTYPEEFDIGVYERVRTLNILLQNLYRRIGEEADDVSEKTEVYNHEKDIYHPLSDRNRRQMKSNFFTLYFLIFLTAIYQICNWLMNEVFN